MVILASNSSEKIGYENMRSPFRKFCHEGPFSLDATHIYRYIYVYIFLMLLLVVTDNYIQRKRKISDSVLLQKPLH